MLQNAIIKRNREEDKLINRVDYKVLQSEIIREILRKCAQEKFARWLEEELNILKCQVKITVSHTLGF